MGDQLVRQRSGRLRWERRLFMGSSATWRYGHSQFSRLPFDVEVLQDAQEDRTSAHAGPLLGKCAV